VALIDDVSVAPSGTATGGGRLYVTGTSLHYHDDAGGDVDLLNRVNGTGSSVSGAVARFDGTAGQLQETGFRINDTTALDYPATGSAAAPTFSFSSDSTSGVYWSSTTAIGLATAGADRLTLSSTAVSAPSQPLQADTSLRVGGASGVTTSLSTANLIEDVATASTGAFAWSNSTGSIMNTTSSRDLALSGNLLFANTTNVLSIGHDGTAFACDYLATAGRYIHLTVAGTDMLQLRDEQVRLDEPGTAFTITNRMAVVPRNTTSAYDYAVNSSNRGLLRDSGGNSLMMGLGATKAQYFYKNHNVSWCGLGVLGHSVEGVIFFHDMSIVPSGAQDASQLTLYMELSTGVFGLGGYTAPTSARTVLDGARERATITLGSLSVVHATSTNTDGLTWSSSDDYGVNGTTTGEMATSDDCLVCFTATAEWASNATGYRRLSITRKTGGPTYTVLNSVTTMAVNGDVTAQTVSFFGAIAAATDELTVQVYQDSTLSLNVDLSASFVRYDTDEPV